MFECRLSKTYGKVFKTTLTAYFSDLDEVAIWMAEWVRLGWRITAVGIVEADAEKPPEEYLSRAGDEPEGEDYAEFSDWASFHAVEQYRARRAWLSRHPVFPDVDPPYGKGKRALRRVK